MDEFKIREVIEAHNENAKLLSGFDNAISGIAYRCGSDPVVAYDTAKVIAILLAEGMNEEEAIEYFEYNILGAYVGPNTPVYITSIDEN